MHTYRKQIADYVGNVVRKAGATRGRPVRKRLSLSRTMQPLCTIARRSQIQTLLQRSSSHYGIFHSGHMVECPS